MLLARKVNKIFVILGSACNMNCSYCVQQSTPMPLPTSPTDSFFKFIRKACLNITPEKLNLVFFGGEPLLYFDIIQDIVTKIKDLNIEYSIITNGKLLDIDIITFLNEHNIRVSVSWDGNASNVTRGYDVVKDKLHELLHVKHLGVSGVLSGCTSVSSLLNDFQQLDDLYFAQNRKHIEVNIDDLIPTNTMGSKVGVVDCNSVAEDVATIVDNVMRMETKPYVKYSYLQSMFNTLLFKPPFTGGIGKCRNGTFTLNIDLSGNLYSCHNVHQPIGSIDGDYAKYYATIVSTSETFRNADTCLQCYVKDLCRGGCKLINKSDREAGYCELKKALFTPIIDFYNQIILTKLKEVH